MNDERLPADEHLQELRGRLIKSVVAMLVTTGITFVFHAQILEFLMEPARGFEGVPNE